MTDGSSLLVTMHAPRRRAPRRIVLTRTSKGNVIVHISTRTATALLGSALLLSLLTGCAAGSTANGSAGSDGSSEPSQDATPPTDASAGEATFTAAGRTFTVDLTLCAVHDGAEVLLGGHAREVGGDATGYLDGDSTVLDSDAYGEFRIDIGADGPFQSTDDFLAIGNTFGGGELALSEDGAGHVITADAWDASGNRLGPGAITFRCA